MTKVEPPASRWVTIRTGNCLSSESRVSVCQRTYVLKRWKISSAALDGLLETEPTRYAWDRTIGKLVLQRNVLPSRPATRSAIPGRSQ